jgi:hypothetical protein
MIWYLMGKTTEILLSYEPIEDATLSEEPVSLIDIYKTLELFARLQMKYNRGELNTDAYRAKNAVIDEEIAEFDRHRSHPRVL